MLLCTILVKILAGENSGGPPLRWSVISQGIVSVWGNIHTVAFELYKALVNEMKHKRWTIILGLLPI